MPIGAILGAVGAGVNLLSGFLGKKEQPEQINPLTDQRLKDLIAQLGQAQGQYNTLGAEAGGIRNQQQTVAGNAGRVANKAENLTQASPNAWFEQYLGNIPEYQDIAKEVSEMSMSQYGRDIAEQTNIQMEQALKAAGDATAGQGFSGAAAASAGQAAAGVVGQAGLQQSQMAADIFNQTFNQQAGAGQNLAFQDQQMQHQNALNQLSTALGGYQAQGSILGSAGNNAVQSQGNLGAIINALQGNVQDITQPMYSTPTITNPLAGAGNAIGAMGQFIEGGQQQTMMADLLARLSGNYVSPNPQATNPNYAPKTGVR